MPHRGAESAYLVAGICPTRQGHERTNEVWLSRPGRSHSKGESETYQQRKHHRWKLDREQIRRYGLAAQLDPNLPWWEDISVDRRQIGFATISENVTLACLICEDLARPDPAAELIRAVAPNLVIVLLMDGPQTESRWPARYASVLADDPGSSVLTLTSLGMVDRSRDRQKFKASRKIALGKDMSEGAVEIDLAEGAEAAVLTLTKDARHSEQTCDGRRPASDQKLLVLSHVEPVFTKTAS